MTGSHLRLLIILHVICKYFNVICILIVGRWNVICISLICHQCVTRLHQYIVVCYSYATFVCQLYVLLCHQCAICIPFLCTLMSFICHSYALVRHSCISCMHSYIICISLVYSLMSHSFLLLPSTIYHHYLCHHRQK